MSGFSTEQTDVGLISLDDRRKIKDLEAKNADLEKKLAAALNTVQPQLTTVRGDCLHFGGFTVSDTELEVNCKPCGAKMDPYEVLRMIAHRETNFCYTLNSLRTEAHQLRNEVAKLKAARARMRRTVRSAEDVPPAGIGAIMREHKLYAIHVAGKTGMGFMAIAVIDPLEKVQVRADSGDPEGALTDLVAKLGVRCTDAKPG